jgi:oligopeptide transport system permease protein
MELKKIKRPPYHLAHVDVDPILDMNCPYSPLPEDFEPASKEEKADFIQIQKSVSYWQDAWRRLKRNTVAMVALYVIIALILFAFVGPMLVPYDYSIQVRGEENWPPFWSEPNQKVLDKAEYDGVKFDASKHPLGTDNFGRDNLARLMYGTRISMVVGVVASLIVLVIGATYGSIAGYAGGTVDTIMMRIVEVIYSVPDVLIVLLLGSALTPIMKNYINENTGALRDLINILGPNLIAIFLTFGMLYWVGMSRIIRGQVLTLKQSEYVTAAKALGASGGRVIRKHLLPNCVGQLIVTTCLQIPSAIFLESFLSFLGLGISAPLTSLGSMSSDALGGIYSYPYRLVVPAILLSVLILSFNLFGDGLRDALDPRLKK